MNKQELESKIVWDEYSIGRLPIYLPFLEQEIVFELFTDNKSISERMVSTIQEVVNLPSSSVEKIKDLLWEEADFSFTVVDYGCEPQESETLKQAHFREFKLNSKEDTYTRASILSVQIEEENEEYADNFAEIKIDTATDNLISIIVKNGKIIDYDDDGTFLGWYLEDERWAHHARQKLLNG